MEFEVPVLTADNPGDEELAIGRKRRGFGVDNGVALEVWWGFRFGFWRGKCDVKFQRGGGDGRKGTDWAKERRERKGRFSEEGKGG